DALPGAQIVGDSTQPIYAGNLYYDHDVAGGWFNSSTGYGALGYAIPAAIGAAIAKPDQPTICLTGDGGAQFSLPELAVAAQEGLPVRFVIWNNYGFGEIAAAMRDVDAPVIGCDPNPPRFADTAASHGMVYRQVPDQPEALSAALRDTAQEAGPVMIEVVIAA
ncbi:MAG: thiamine pyrophosphate-dependent enzyme, partial [Pseudomonadota bacterium]|nr:thiamine pyrophosphate-dependent enzyme [Pseudomonadota bacterium]